jgi:hypothetical protein
MSARLRRAMSTEALVRSTFIAYACGVTLIAFSKTIWLAMAGLCICGACWVLALDLQRDGAALGRAGSSAGRWRCTRWRPSAAWRWELGLGPLGLHFGVEKALLMSATVARGAVMGLRYRLPPLEELNLDPLSRWREPRSPSISSRAPARSSSPSNTSSSRRTSSPS